MNSDGDISVVDATLVQKYIVGLEKLTDLQKKSAEVNGDGEISVVDATLIQSILSVLKIFIIYKNPDTVYAVSGFLFCFLNVNRQFNGAMVRT